MSGADESGTGTQEARRPPPAGEPLDALLERWRARVRPHGWIHCLDVSAGEAVRAAAVPGSARLPGPGDGVRGHDDSATTGRPAGGAGLAVLPTQSSGFAGWLQTVSRELLSGDPLLVIDRLPQERWEDLVASLLEAGFRPGRETELASSDGPEDRASRDVWRALEASRDAFRIRPATEADVPAILDLFEASFHHRRGPEHWHWKYASSPWGNGRVSVVIEEGRETRRGQTEEVPDRIVGQYCAYPVPLAETTADGDVQRWRAHQVGDTMTARHVRAIGRGPTSLLARSARHFYARFCRDRVAFNYGFNTGNIRRFSMRFVGAQLVESAPYRWLSGDALERRRSKGGLADPGRTAGLLRPWRRQRVERLEGPERLDESVETRLDGLFQKVLPDYGLTIERDSRWLRWRYLTAPDAEYRVYLSWRGRRLTGWSVFRPKEDRLEWGDALFVPSESDAVEAVLEAALAEAPEARAVVGWFPTRPAWWSSRVAALGFEPAEEPDDLAMVVVPFEIADPVPTLQRRLYYCKGDSDLF